MTCWRTRSRRAVSAAAVEVGLASIDWQMPNAPQAKRALPLSLPIAHRRLMSGTLTTNTRAAGGPAADTTVARAASTPRPRAVRRWGMCIVGLPWGDREPQATDG